MLHSPVKYEFFKDNGLFNFINSIMQTNTSPVNAEMVAVVRCVLLQQGNSWSWFYQN